MMCVRRGIIERQTKFMYHTHSLWLVTKIHTIFKFSMNQKKSQNQ